MNIQQIKSEIAAKNSAVILALNMVRQFADKDKKQPEPWLSHWDNDKRIRVTMHEDVFNQIKLNPKMEGLAYKSELVAAEYEADSTTVKRAAYLRYVVITPTSIEGVF